jgi:hypothetical protein
MKAEVNAFYAAAIAAGATDNGKPGAPLYYDPRYYAANVFDPDDYSIEVVYKSWQHQSSPRRELGSHERSNALPQQLDHTHQFGVRQRRDAHLEREAGYAP